MEDNLERPVSICPLVAVLLLLRALLGRRGAPVLGQVWAVLAVVVDGILLGLLVEVDIVGAAEEDDPLD